MSALPRIVADGKTPAQWVDELAGHGIEVSERTLRARARALGACKLLGSTMILLPEHIDRIFVEATCRSNSTSGTASTGSVDELLMETTTNEEALEHLTRLSRRQRSGPSKRQQENVVSLDPTRRKLRPN